MSSIDDAVLQILETAPTPDEESRRLVADRAANVLRPAGALARLDDVCAWLASWQHTTKPAVAAALFGGPAEEWTGRGTGVDDETWSRKVAAVEAARARIPANARPLETLRQVGGAELVAIAGAMTEARARSIPVLLDGFVVTAAVAPLAVLHPGALDNCIAGHRSPEPGHSMLLDKLGLEPLLDLGMRLGEASGALAALPLVRLAATVVVDVATFEEWGLTR